MPPVTLYTREDVIQAAFEIFRKEGMNRITVRRIARQLDSSVMPIYSNFKSIDQVKQAVMDKTLQLLGEYTEKHYSDNVFLNIGLGVLAFARDYQTLYKAIFIESDAHSHLIDAFFVKNLAAMRKEAFLSQLTDDELKRVLEKTRLFTHGLAAFICSGNFKNTSDAYIQTLMKEVGEDIVGYTLYRKKSRNRQE